jgi:hypothetical protein
MRAGTKRVPAQAKRVWANQPSRVSFAFLFVLNCIYLVNLHYHHHHQQQQHHPPTHIHTLEADQSVLHHLKDEN